MQLYIYHQHFEASLDTTNANDYKNNITKIGDLMVEQGPVLSLNSGTKTYSRNDKVIRGAFEICCKKIGRKNKRT